MGSEEEEELGRQINESMTPAQIGITAARELYVLLREAGFTMLEALTYLVVNYVVAAKFE